MPPPVRPVDAAGLVLLRESSRGLEVLMGRRHGRASFLPDVFVFPGGRVEAMDFDETGFGEALSPAVAAMLSRPVSRVSPAALARAAIRETYEETGLMLGRPASVPPGRPVAPWGQFARLGLAPALDAMLPVARAITPTDSPVRFHTRFLWADGGLAQGEIGGDGELEEPGWRTIGEIRRLPLVDVTQFVLAEAVRRWRGAVAREAPPPLYCYRSDHARVIRRP